MSDMTQEQIAAEFKRQVYLCSGLGFDEMLKILKSQFKPQHEWQFYANGTFCKKCGASIGTERCCE